MACLTVIGELCEGHAGLLNPYLPDIISAVAKNIKTHEWFVRESAMICLKQMFEVGISRLVDLHSEVWKTILKSVQDRSQLVRIAAASCIVPFASQTTTVAWDVMAGLCIKALDDPILSVRSAFAESLSGLLWNAIQTFAANKAAQIQAQAAINAALASGNLPDKDKKTDSGVNPLAALKQKAAEDKKKSAVQIPDVETAFAFLQPIFIKAGTSRDVRLGICQTFIAFALRTRSNSPMQTVIRTLLELLANPRIFATANNQSADVEELFFIRQTVSWTLRNVLDLYNESQQVACVQELANWLGKTGTNDHQLICCLHSLSFLFLRLGEGLVVIPEQILSEPILALLNRVPAPGPSSRDPILNTSVEALATWIAWSLRCLARSLPSHLLHLLSVLLNMTTIDHAELATAKPNTNVVPYLEALLAHSQSLASLVTVISESRRGVPHDITSAVLTTAKSLITQTGGSPAVACIRKECGWRLMEAMLVMGTEWAGSRLTTLFALWKQVLGKKGMEGISAADPNLHLELRSRLGGLYALRAFVTSCSSLLTSQLLKPIVLFLSNTLVWTAQLPPASLSPVVRRELCAVKSVLFDAFRQLPPVSYMHRFVPLMQMVVADLTDPNNPSVPNVLNEWLSEEDEVLRPVHQSQVDDFYFVSMSSMLSHSQDLEQFVRPWTYPATRLAETTPRTPDQLLLDSALRLFAAVFSCNELAPNNRHLLVDHFSTQVRESGKLQTTERVDSLHRTLQLRISLAIVGAMRISVGTPKPAINQKDDILIQELRGLLIDLLAAEDPTLRSLGGEGLGLLGRLGGDPLCKALMKDFDDMLNTSSDANLRAGIAFGIGCLHRYVSAMNMTRFLPASVAMLHKLAKETNQPIRTWCLHSLKIAAETAGLSFASYIKATVQLSYAHLLADARTDIQVSYCVGRIIGAVIGAIGPELQANTERMNRCLTVFNDLRTESHPWLELQSIHIIEQLFLFAPQITRTKALYDFLKSKLLIRDFPRIKLTKLSLVVVKLAAQRRETDILGVERLEDTLFEILDDASDREVIREVCSVLETLVDMHGATSVSRWLDVIKRIIQTSKQEGGVTGLAAMAAEKDNQKAAKDNGEDQNSDQSDDEEIEIKKAPAPTLSQRSKAANQAAAPSTDNKKPFSPRSSTRWFALCLLKRLLNSIPSDPRHTDLILARQDIRSTAGSASAQPSTDDKPWMVLRLGELISLAFSGATASTDSVRVLGVKLLKNIVQRFGNSLDPDSNMDKDDLSNRLQDKLLLQYEAQFAAATRSSFTPDAAPELTCASCDFLQTYLRAGITTDLVVTRRLVGLLAQPLSSLQLSMNPLYCESVSSMVHLRRLRALALLLRCPEPTESLKKQMEDCTEGLRNHLTAALTDFSVLVSQPKPVIKSYQPFFFLHADLVAVGPFYRHTFYLFLEALCSLVDSNDWKAAANEPDSVPEYGSRLPSFSARFSLLLGLCVIGLTRLSVNDSIISLTHDAADSKMSSTGDESAPDFSSEQSVSVQDDLSGFGFGSMSYSSQYQRYKYKPEDGIIAVLKALANLLKPCHMKEELFPRESFVDLLRVLRDVLAEMGSAAVDASAVTMMHTILSDTHNKDLLTAWFRDTSSTVNGLAQTMNEVILSCLFRQAPWLHAKYDKSEVQLSEHGVAVCEAALSSLPIVISVVVSAAHEDSGHHMFTPFVCTFLTVALKSLVHAPVAISKTAFRGLKSICDVLSSLEGRRVDLGWGHWEEKILASAIQFLLVELNQPDRFKSLLPRYSPLLLSLLHLFTCLPDVSSQTATVVQGALMDTLSQCVAGGDSQFGFVTLQVVRAFIVSSLGQANPSKPSVTLCKALLATLTPVSLSLFAKLPSQDDSVNDMVLEGFKVHLLCLRYITSEPQHMSFLSVTLPLIAWMLQPSTDENVKALASQTLMQIARGQTVITGDAFRNSVQALSVSDRSSLEQCIRANIQSEQQAEAAKQQQTVTTTRAVTSQVAAPKIQLKMNFGGGLKK
eukprot:GILJ01008652.1.p1 GENE.GILJ01008652.1~~GILJ01008652.1.p1  ORF type:complete len:2092 (-),score=402.65 GILJ01008652.1:70-6057(-)